MLAGRNTSSCRMDEEAWTPPARMIKLTKEREIEPYPWVHPDEERWGAAARSEDAPRCAPLILRLGADGAV